MLFRFEKIKIRPYTEEDYEFTHDLHRQNMITYINKYWGGWDSDVYRKGVCPEITWMIEYHGQKAGFFVLTLDTEAHLKNIQISSAFQNMGFGRQVLAHCECESLNRGFDYLYLEVFRDNPARHLYERLGYVTYKVTESHFMMKKELIAHDLSAQL